MDGLLREKMRATGQLDISVRNPHTYEKFTSFEIAIQTKNPAFSSSSSRTRRRYSEFCWLRKRLRAHHPLISPPKLSGKKSAAERFDPQFLVQRMKELEDWLYMVVDTTLYLSDTAVHLFLQSLLSCDKIDQYLAGKLSESEREQAEKQSKVEPDGTSVAEQIEADHIVCKPKIHVQEPVAISMGPENTLHVINGPVARGDSGLALSSESDCDSSYESNNTSLQGSAESSKYSFPEVTLVEAPIENHCVNKQETSQSEGEQGTSQSSHLTQSDSHMSKHSVQSSLMCEGGIVFTKQVKTQSSVDSETQTPGGRIVNKTEALDDLSDDIKLEPGTKGVKVDEGREAGNIAEYLSQISIETCLQYSINADVHEN